MQGSAITNELPRHAHKNFRVPPRDRQLGRESTEIQPRRIENQIQSTAIEGQPAPDRGQPRDGPDDSAIDL